MHKNLKIICNSTNKPKLIKTEFSLAIIGGILLQFNQVNLQQYLDQCFKVISEKEEMVSTFCVPVVCSAHLMRGVKYLVESSKWSHRNNQLKQLILKITYAVYHMFFTQYIGKTFLEHMQILEKAINRHDVDALVLGIDESKKN